MLVFSFRFRVFFRTRELFMTAVQYNIPLPRTLNDQDILADATLEVRVHRDRTVTTRFFSEPAPLYTDEDTPTDVEEGAAIEIDS